ncbi:MAG: SOUL family heme-binding protein [Aquidulcibacter sp.]|jgi:hypothetical protein
MFEPNAGWERTKMMTKSLLRPALALFLPLLSAIGLASPTQADTPEPTFKRVLRDGTFEIRDYDSQVVAEVRVPEGRGDPANAGFRPLARYIFGGNKPRASIAMTAPVTRQQEGQSIAMTAPVTRQDAGAEWKVRFIMPEGSTLATMPVPNDPNVRLLEEPAKRYGVITFSGFGSQAMMAQKSEELRTWLRGKKLTPIGAPIYASYDPPWTAPFLRRHEVWLALAAPAKP